MHSGTSLVIGLCEKPNLPGGASFSTIASLLLSSDGLNFRRLTYCVIPYLINGSSFLGGFSFCAG
jgi:hypothetical protein